MARVAGPPRVLAVGAVVAVLAVVALGAAPTVSAGQVSEVPTTSTTAAAGSSTTLPDGATTTTTELVPPSSTTTRRPDLPSSTVAPSTTVTTLVPVPEVDPGAVPTDPLAGAFLTPEDQALYEALDGVGDARAGFYAAQPAFDPAVANAVLAPQVDQARTALDQALLAQRRALDHEATTSRALVAAEAELGGLDDERRARVADAASAEEDLRRRAVDAYVRSGGGIDVTSLAGAATAGEAAQRAGLLDAVLQGDVRAARDARAALDGLDDEERAGAERLATARRAALDAADARRAADWERMAAESMLAMYEAGSHVAIAGFVFPVDGQVTFIDSYGAPRNVGTGYEHWHEGTDVMAAMGTPVVAVEDGVVERARPSSLGGNALRLRGESGHGFYYAHLAAYAPGIAEGVPVAAGQLLGFVGDTGDARGGAPHLHFEIHRPGTDEPVNPYPLLAVAWRARQEVPLAAGTDGAAVAWLPTPTPTPTP